MSLHHQLLKRPMQLLGLNALRAPATSWDAPGVIFLKLLAVVSRVTTEWGIHEMPDSDKLEKDEQPLRLFVFVAEGMMT